MNESPWGVVELRPDGPDGEEHRVELGTLRLRVARRFEELWIHGSHAEGDGALARRASGDDPLPEEWVRWAISGDTDPEIRRRLPDRPIVVSPEQPFVLPPAGRARVFVRVPLFVAVSVPDEGGEGRILEEFPTLVLSDTWWGSFTEGEVAYWVGTRARRRIAESDYEPHMAICPFLLDNASEEALPVERFAVRPAHLTLFARGAAAWTDEVRVRYRGGVEVSDVRYTGRVPDEAGDIPEIAPPREEPDRSLHARTFGRLRAKVAAL